MATPKVLPPPSARSLAAVGTEIENGPAAGEHQREATADAQHAERHDERLHVEIGDEQAVHEADEPCGQEPHADAGPDRIAGIHDHREDDTAEADSRADRNIDTSRDDHGHHAERDDCDEGEVARDVETINRLIDNPTEQELQIRERLKLVQPRDKVYIIGQPDQPQK